QTRRPPHQPPDPPGTGPLVTFARSGITAPFGHHGRSVLDLADACDVPTRWSCRTGVCHTCITPLLSGDITYSPDPLEPPADGQTITRWAHPPTKLVLDRSAATAMTRPPEPSPGEYALSPAIGPIPAIYVHLSHQHATTQPQHVPIGGTMSDFPADLRYSTDH